MIQNIVIYTSQKYILCFQSNAINHPSVGIDYCHRGVIFVKFLFRSDILLTLFKAWMGVVFVCFFIGWIYNCQS